MASLQDTCEHGLHAHGSTNWVKSTCSDPALMLSGVLLLHGAALQQLPEGCACLAGKGRFGLSCSTAFELAYCQAVVAAAAVCHRPGLPVHLLLLLPPPPAVIFTSTTAEGVAGPSLALLRVEGRQCSWASQAARCMAALVGGDVARSHQAGDVIRASRHSTSVTDSYCAS
ncbi:hypothetical protein HaLaN_28933 [Haematococcus lacustris]|uniref:Uncharacterized protein n=1 Tax=Haematococcus lacustris TaxID=44745 RepID=A0A6A0AD09_HAELA|nr:hypothetical protein HaLaN_28933 [Haematococcus lacustris]